MKLHRVQLFSQAWCVHVQMREAKTESMSEVQELNHKVAKARVMGSWSKQLEIKVRQCNDLHVARYVLPVG